MDVSKKLAQLVTEPEGGHESRHFGTVTAVSAIDATHSVVTVLLDGATETTVCDSHDVKVTVNDRVEVEVRDHRATVKANSTHPVTDDEAAETAWSHADSAATAAANAWTKAGEAATAASNAQTSANNAADAAANAWDYADSALTAAGNAWDYADTAKGAADQAQADATAAGTAASNAQTSAATAKQAADRSLVQLSIVENVAGTLNWIAEHGTYEATTDTTVQDGKVYFELVSGDYVPIAQPTGNPQQQGWYVLDITDSQTEYIMAHLAVTSQGLWVLPSGIGSETTPDADETQADSDARQGDGYKVLLSSRGMTVYDNYGDAVATYGETTTFASDRDWYVGNAQAFVFYDASEGTLQIGGANVTIGGLTPGQLAGSQIWTATADPTTPSYTFAISNLTGPSGVSPRVGDLVMRGYYRYTVSSVASTTVLTGNRTSIRGAQGAAGSSVTVSSVEYAYQLSTSGTTVPTGTWGSTPVAPTATQYAWTRTTTTYSDNTTAVTYTVGGKGGADGSPGTSVTISSKSVKYQASTSGTTTPTGTWLDSVPTVAQGSYLWTRTVVTYSTGDSTTAYSVARMGSDGQTGAAGPEAVVSISVTAANFSANTGTLSASLRVNGTVTTPTSYKWTKGTATTSLGTSQTLSITDLNATYNCTVTWSGGTQVGSIDLAATSAVKTYAAATFATQDTVSSMEAGIEQNARDITLRATKTEAYQLSQPNLTPYFLMPMTQTTDTYWDNISYTRFTQLEDGWAHFSYANSGSSTVNNYILPKVITTLTPGGRYTLLVEFRNVSISSDGGNFYSQQNVYAQVWGTDSYGGFSISNAAIRALANGQGVFRKSLTLLTADSKDPSGTVRGSLPKTQFMSINQQVTAGQSVSYDLRLSLYEGEYTGPYKPYVGGNLYASQAELKVTNNNVSSKVSTTDYNGQTIASLINQSADSVVIEADHIELNGTTVFNTIKSTLDSTYDEIGAASAVQTNLNNLQIGGRNLFALSNAVQGYIRSSSPYGEIVLTPTSPQHITSDFIPVSQGDIFTTQLWNPNLVNNTTNSNRGVCWYDSSKAYISMQTGTGDATGARPTGVAHWSFTFNPAPANAAYARFGFIIGPSTNVIDPDIKIKVERGNKPTDWSPSPEDQTAYVDAIQVGGRNLLLGTADWSKWHNSAGATISGGELSYSTNTTTNRLAGVAVVPSETYTLSVDMKADSAYTYGTTGNTCLLLDYSSTESYSRVTTVWIAYGTALTTSWKRYSFTFTVPSDSTIGWLFVSLRNVTSSPPTYYMRHMKLERGNKSTDWTPAPEDQTAYVDSSRTWNATSTTAAGTAAKEATITPATTAFTLTTGVTVSVKFSNTNSAAAANLTLSVNGTTAKPVRYMYNTGRNQIPSAGYLVAGTIYTFIYDGDYWTIQNLHYNTNDNDRKRHSNGVKAAENIAQYKICCGTSAGYKAIAASVTFDLSYPLLYLSSANQSGQSYAVASGGTSTAFYEALPSVTFTNTATIESGGAYKMLYLKGTVSGNTFTVAAFNFLTTVVPSAVTDPTAFYIPLGMMTSATAGYFATSKDLYAYADGKFRQVNPTDIVSSQRIYYCTDLANSELVGPTSAWVTQDGNVYNAWTTKVPPIAASTAEGEDKYPFLYTCEQRKRLDGTIACTDVGLDESVGVIDGGSIIMHSIVAEKIDAHSINSSHVLSVGAFTDEDYELISNAGVKEDLSKLSAAFADYTDVTGQWIHVDRSTGVILGKTGSSDYQQLTNDRQMFVSSGVVVAYTYKGRFYGKAMEAEEMHIGEFMWVARSNGHFSLKYVGGGS